LAVFGAVIAVAISLPVGAGASAADKADEPVGTDALKTGLMAALGDSFEYVGGEVGRAGQRSVDFPGVRFWFAKVRLKAAGDFAVMHTSEFDVANAANMTRPLRKVQQYIIQIKVGERGGPRLIIPGAYGGSAWPHANVGDVIIIPVPFDRRWKGHTFAVLDEKDRRVKSFFSVVDRGRRHETIMKQAAEKAVVRNDGGDWLDLLASWGDSLPNHVMGGPTRHDLSAYLQFKRPGEFNLAGRLVNPDQKRADLSTKRSDYAAPHEPIGEAQGKPDDGVAFRVRPKNDPVTVVLDHIFRDGSSGAVPSGTIEVRVGDRVLMRCGEYSTAGDGKPHAYREGVLIVRPFKPVEPYFREQEITGKAGR
jgi:hypothetical protein